MNISTLPFVLKDKDVAKSLLTKPYQTNMMLALESILRQHEEYDAGVIKNFFNPQLCREDLLPYLARYLNVPYWSNTFTLEQKRKLCQNALPINRERGTLKALKNALKDLNLSVSVIEWFQDPVNLPKGTARLIFYEQNINYSQEQYEAVESLIE